MCFVAVRRPSNDVKSVGQVSSFPSISQRNTRRFSSEDRTNVRVIGPEAIGDVPRRSSYSEVHRQAHQDVSNNMINNNHANKYLVLPPAKKALSPISEASIIAYARSTSGIGYGSASREYDMLGDDLDFFCEGPSEFDVLRRSISETGTDLRPNARKTDSKYSSRSQRLPGITSLKESSNGSSNDSSSGGGSGSGSLHDMMTEKKNDRRNTSESKMEEESASGSRGDRRRRRHLVNKNVVEEESEADFAKEDSDSDIHGIYNSFSDCNLSSTSPKKLSEKSSASFHKNSTSEGVVESGNSADSTTGIGAMNILGSKNTVGMSMNPFRSFKLMPLRMLNKNS